MPLLVRERKKQDAHSALMLVNMFWKPADTLKSLEKEDGRGKPVDAAAAIARAQEIVKMHGSNAYRKPE